MQVASQRVCEACVQEIAEGLQQKSEKALPCMDKSCTPITSIKALIGPQALKISIVQSPVEAYVCTLEQ